MKTSKYIAHSAIIAALYAALTLLLSPISYGVMQLRLSEALVVLCLYTPAAVPGLFVGCFVANLMGPGGITDALIGGFATLIGCLGVWLLRSRPWAALMCNVVSNAVIVGIMLRYLYGVEMSVFLCMAWVGLGELLSCYVPGYPLKKLLDKRAKDLHII
ncbi:MAG TPA: QueT transporter family protein [Bacillota bacterium]|nr:QueT transporter family protein [Bacillota bacterium]